MSTSAHHSKHVAWIDEICLCCRQGDPFYGFLIVSTLHFRSPGLGPLASLPQATPGANLAPPPTLSARAYPAAAAGRRTPPRRWRHPAAEGDWGVLCAWWRPARGGVRGRACGSRAGGLGWGLRWRPLAGAEVAMAARLAVIVLGAGPCGAAWSASLQIEIRSIWGVKVAVAQGG
jgi:hypothetical protein